MEIIKLSIPSMKSAHCQMTVSNVVHALGGTIKHIEPAQVEVALENTLTKETVVRVIEEAGYKVTNA